MIVRIEEKKLKNIIKTSLKSLSVDRENTIPIDLLVSHIFLQIELAGGIEGVGIDDIKKNEK